MGPGADSAPKKNIRIKLRMLKARFSFGMGIFLFAKQFGLNFVVLFVAMENKAAKQSESDHKRGQTAEEWGPSKRFPGKEIKQDIAHACPTVDSE
jgi:hypothetical protein